MEARAHLRYARIAPRKVSVVLDLIRGQDLDKAMAILQYTPNAVYGIVCITECWCRKK